MGVPADPFSTYRSGFEIRTYRPCRRLLMFHQISELGADRCWCAPPTSPTQAARRATGPSSVGLLAEGTQTGWIARSGGGYRTVPLPPLTLGYSPLAVDDTLHTLGGVERTISPACSTAPPSAGSTSTAKGRQGILTETTVPGTTNTTSAPGTPTAARDRPLRARRRGRDQPSTVRRR